MKRVVSSMGTSQEEGAGLELSVPEGGPIRALMLMKTTTEASASLRGPVKT